jgi:hypothetical protein
MAMLVITADQLVAMAAVVWHDREHMPAQLWVDHFHQDHTFLRATYPEELCRVCLDRLHEFKKAILQIYGPDADVTVVIYEDEIPVEEAVARSTTINLVP